MKKANEQVSVYLNVAVHVFHPAIQAQSSDVEYKVCMSWQ